MAHLKYEISMFRHTCESHNETYFQESNICFMFPPFFFPTLSHGMCEYNYMMVSLFVQTKNNTTAAQEKCITRLLLYHFCVNLPVMIMSYPVFRFMGMRSTLPLPSWYIQVPYILMIMIEFTRLTVFTKNDNLTLKYMN